MIGGKEEKFHVGVVNDEARKSLPNIQKDFWINLLVEKEFGLLPGEKVFDNEMQIVFIVDDDIIIDTMGHMFLYDFKYVVFDQAVDFHYYLVFICIDERENNSDKSHLADGRFTLPLCPFRAMKEPMFNKATDVLIQKAVAIRKGYNVHTGIKVIGKTVASKLFGDEVCRLGSQGIEYPTVHGFNVSVIERDSSLGIRAFRTECRFAAMPEAFEFASQYGKRLDNRIEAAKFCPYCAEHMIPKE
jgi:hypothetical protein